MISERRQHQIVDWLLGIADGVGVPTEEDILAEPNPGIQEIMAAIMITRQDVVDDRRELTNLKTDLSAIVAAIDEGLIVCSLNGTVLWANPAAEMFFRRDPGGLVGEDLGIAYSSESTQIQGNRPGGRDGIAELISTRVVWHGQESYMFTLRDITDRAELERRALHDPLTGLPNRILLMSRLEQALARMQRHDKGLCLMFLDLDRFKRVNDVLGHTTGDQLLQAVSARLSGVVRAMDTVARIGGDEFLILCEGIDTIEESDDLISRVGEIFSEPFSIGPEIVDINASIGVRLVTDWATRAELIISDADTAMYAAKQKGRATHRYFETPMRAESEQRYEFGRALSAAFQEGDLEMHYQPIVDQSGVAQGFEALMRWRHQTRGLVPAAQFIAVAEDNGLIVEMGKWALDAACAQASAWNRLGPGWHSMLMNVNLSAMQVSQPNIVDIVAETLQRHGLPASQLGLEITETAVMQEGPAAVRRIQEIRALGADVLIDDFGTGYASLTYLRTLPITTLKIDQSFTAHVAENSTDLAIVRSQVNLAAEMGLTTVAEGVETIEQHKRLVDIGCDQFQGFLYRQPASAQHVEEVFDSLGGPHQSLLPFPHNRKDWSRGDGELTRRQTERANPVNKPRQASSFKPTADI